MRLIILIKHIYKNIYIINVIYNVIKMYRCIIILLINIHMNNIIYILY